ncbi:orofacial cleft 1 candidate gene 1 protein [Fukomys damarensis]|uniref:orofacial cleft 1 candidate gene 1 protein n=1 Tax=Fukomys damarensis TaxID=885580 RepID=UPI0005403746|nr:orofacial cleft 1 candidate gene 1 protein [Fukomys damarensis]
MDGEKFQQKALKQNKQKKSKSAEFLMVKEDREATEGFENPAFNMSTSDLSAHQASEEKIIRHDTLDRTLAAHQQKSRLPVSTEPKGNEYGRNYFDPLMDEEINPRQCGMEVSREGDNKVFCNQLMELSDESGREESQDGSTKEEILDSEALTSSCKIYETHKEADEAIPDSIKAFERHAQKDITLIGSSPFEQDLKFEEGLHQYIPMSCLKMDKTSKKVPGQPFTAALHVCKNSSVTKLGSLTEVTHSCQGVAGSGWKVEQSQPPQLLQIQIKCIRGLKDKAPRGCYFLKVSLLSRLGGCVLQWWPTEQLRTRTHPVRHDGNFYNTGLFFHQSLYMGFPQRKDVKPGMAFLFELFLLRGTCACLDQAVGWAVFPVCDNNFDIVEGKFKSPILRGHYEKKLSSFRKIEDLICLDLDHWLCNLYFQVIKLPLHFDDQKVHENCTRLSPEFSVCLVAEAEKAKLNTDNPAGLSGKTTQEKIPVSTEHGAESALHSSHGSISNKTDLCPTDCDLGLLKEDHEFHSKGGSLTDHSVKEKPTICKPGEFEDYLQDTSYLEELEKHQFSVCVPCKSVSGGRWVSTGRLKSLHWLQAEGSAPEAEESALGGRRMVSMLKCHTFIPSRGRGFEGDIGTLPATALLLAIVSSLQPLLPHASSSCTGTTGPTGSGLKLLILSSSIAGSSGSGGLFKHLHFVMVSVFSELQFAQWQSQGFWCTILLLASLCFLRLCLHYLGQWLFLQAISAPVTKFHLYPYTVELCYLESSLSISEELAVVVVGPLMLNTAIFLLVLIRWGCRLLFASCPDVLSKLIIAMGLWTVLDPLMVLIVDIFLGRLTRNGEAPIADAAKLYWVFVRTQQSQSLAVMITTLLYIFLFIISSLILYMYCLRLHSDSWILDAFQRVHSEETKFFVPYDLEISNQELSYIVKRSEQWRGVGGERRKVAVYDYIRRSHSIKSSVSSCDLPHQNEISVSALGAGDITSHVSVYTVYPSGFQELFRHFLRLPSGAIVEVFGDISALQFVPSEVAAAIQEHISEMDTGLRDSCTTSPRHEKDLLK